MKKLNILLSVLYTLTSAIAIAGGGHTGGGGPNVACYSPNPTDFDNLNELLPNDSLLNENSGALVKEKIYVANNEAVNLDDLADWYNKKHTGSKIFFDENSDCFFQEGNNFHYCDLEFDTIDDYLKLIVEYL